MGQMTLLRATLYLFALLQFGNQAAYAGERVALVIGNATYATTTRLTNPQSDAKLVSDALRKTGFDTVTVSDASLLEFRAALRNFRSKAASAEIAMVYYAGHGIEADGKNWLIPVDAQLEQDFDLPDQAVDLDRVLDAMAGAKVRVVVLDACRNNPFGRSWASGTRAVSRGLGRVEVDDVMIIYAAAPGATALDGAAGNSPFARSLAARLIQSDLPVQLLGGAVRDDVLTATRGSQRPFVSASMTGTPIYLTRSPSAPPVQHPSVAPVYSVVDPGIATPEIRHPLLPAPRLPAFARSGRFQAIMISNSENRFLPNLPTVAKDVEDIGSILHYKYHFILTNVANANRYTILSELNKALENSGPNDSILIYYAGHSVYDAASGRCHWLPADADPSSSANWISTYQISDILKVLPARKVMVMSDACFSSKRLAVELAGSPRPTNKTDPSALGADSPSGSEAEAAKNTRVALTSGNAGPVAGSNGHSVFADGLLQTLSNNGDSLEGTRLWAELAKRLGPAPVRSGLQFNTLPIAGHEAGDFILYPQ